MWVTANPNQYANYICSVTANVKAAVGTTPASTSYTTNTYQTIGTTDLNTVSAASNLISDTPAIKSELAVTLSTFNSSSTGWYAHNCMSWYTANGTSTQLNFLKRSDTVLFRQGFKVYNSTNDLSP